MAYHEDAGEEANCLTPCRKYSRAMRTLALVITVLMTLAGCKEKPSDPKTPKLRAILVIDGQI